jgi:hypothetical protein
MLRVISLLMLVLLSPALSLAAKRAKAPEVPQHKCQKPERPEYMNRGNAQQFSQVVERYKKCISEFIEQQNALAKQHQQKAQQHNQAASDTLNEWNQFISEDIQRTPVQ